MIRKILSISLLYMISAVSVINAQDSAIGADIREDENGIRNVYITKDSKVTSITKFKNPHHIYSAEFSPSQKWLLITHMDYKPLKLAVYDLSTYNLVKRTEPGHGWHFSWTTADTIIHYWGCGSSCVQYTLYDHHLNVMFTKGTTGITISPARDKMITFPSTAADDEGIIVYYFKNPNKEHKISIAHLSSVARII